MRIVGGGCLPLHALTLPRPVLRLAEFFQGGGRVGVGSGALACGLSCHPFSASVLCGFCGT